jgi:Tol biopolymer transport system component/DNA-binding winged helix-turn-helix (wHTH) protein
LHSHRLYRFESFCLDATAKVLLKDGQTVAMTRKAVETLLVLVENSGQVVPKEEMLSAIWPDRVVDEANLTQNIAMVRRALGAERGTPAYIETFPGRGYRLLGPVFSETPVVANGHERIAGVNGASGVVANDLTETAAETTHPLPQTPSASIPRSRFWGAILVVLALAGTLTAVWFITQRSTRAPEQLFRVSPFTRLPGKELQPALSPDGKRVAFLWDQGTGQPPDLRVQAADETSPVQITREEGHYSSPAWSPDGRALAFLRIEPSATEVLIASTENGASSGRLVAWFTPPNYGFQYRLLDWSPDGQWLAVSHTDSPDKPNGLFLVNVATGEKKSLTKPEKMVGGDMDPRFSPDGRSITFIRHIHRSHQELYSIALNSGNGSAAQAPQQLTADAKQISGHDWLADGSGIVFASDRGGEFRLWRMRVNGEKNPQAIGIYGEFPIELSLARKSSLLAYSVQQQDRNIWRLDLKEKRWTRVIASSAQDASPQYSPAGDKICFRSDRTGEEQLWVSDADGNHQIQITKGTLYPSVGHWSPDGRRIAFNNARTGELMFASSGTDGSWAVRGTGITGIHPVFSADGQWVFAGTSSSIIKLPADNGAGGAAAELVKTRGISLAVSIDGKWLYFMRDANDSVLWRARTDTGEFAKALDGVLPNCTSCWALDPNGIYYLGSDKQSFDTQVVYFHDFAAGRDREILKYPEPLAPVGSGPFSLSPDLRSLLCVRVDPSNSDIMRVETFR